MQKRDLLIGAIILVIIGAIIYWANRPSSKKSKQQATPAPTASVQEVIENQFKIQIPETAEKAELKDVAGGSASGIATREFKNGKFSHTVLADLPDPKAGEFYQGWLVKGKEGDVDFSFISTGRLRLAKGGYLLEFSSAKDYSDYKNVAVTLETKADNKMETRILDGSF